MTDAAKKLLRDIVHHPSYPNGLKLEKNNIPDSRKDVLLAYKELIQLGYIVETGKAIGVQYFDVTNAGIAAADEE